MSKIKAKKLLAEAKRRQGEAFDAKKYCFKEQWEFINDPSYYKTACTSRRAGKSTSCAVDLINTALNNDKADLAYITLSITSGKRIIWRMVKDICETHAIDVKANEIDSYFEFSNKSRIYISGAKDMMQVEKLRGMAFSKVYIDEAQSFKNDLLQYLIDDVLEASLIDKNGQLILIGTPGPIPQGYFYEQHHNKAEEWKHFHWTMRNNPNIGDGTPESLQLAIDRIKKRRGISETDPSFRREFLGEWIMDTDSLIYKYKPEFNTYKELPEGRKYEYVFGIDLGYNDADAIAVLAFDLESPEVYLVEEDITPEQDITTLAEKIKKLQEKYKPIKMKIDAGALGKKIADEIKVRHQIPVEAAEKSRKWEFISLLNDDLRNQRFFVKEDSQLAHDMLNLTYEVDVNSNKLKENPNFHSDISDAALYAWREAKHYASRMKKEKVKKTDEEKVLEFWERALEHNETTWLEDVEQEFDD